MNTFSNPQILTNFKALMAQFVSDTNLNINQVTFTSVDNLNGGILNDDTTTSSLSYPLLNTYLQLGTISTNTLVLDFEIAYFDRLLKDGENLVKIWDDATSTLGYVLRNLQLNRDFIFKNEETQLEWFKFDLDDECAGVKATVRITFDIAYTGNVNCK